MTDHIWIGDNFDSRPERVLVLGESWYGDLEPLRPYVLNWAKGEFRDQTFSRVSNVLKRTGYTFSRTCCHLDAWNQIAFCNFVVGTVGKTRDERPKTSHYEASRECFHMTLSMVKPRAVWILGTEQAKYSVPVVEKEHVMFQVAPHPVSRGLRNDILDQSWRLLVARLPRI